MDKYLLKLVAIFKTIFTNQGINYARMMTIVQTKLMMDKRRVYMNWKQRQQKKESSNHLNGVLFFYGLMGVFISFVLFMLPSLVLAMILMHSYILFMMSMTLITDFSTVLLDTTDNQVILPKPISSKTLFMARLIHILIYLLQFTIAIAIIPIGITFFKFGFVAGFVMIFTVLLTVLMAVFITYLLYLLIIRFSSEKKVKDIVNYFQIFMTILFTVGFQVLPRIVDISEMMAAFELHWYAYFLPPVWMALTIEAFSSLQFDALHVGMIAAAFILPIFTFWLMNKYLAPSFAKKLDAMNVGDEGHKIAKVNINQKRKLDISQKISSIVCSSPVEKSTFHLTWKMTARDKSFKLQFYPGLAYMVVFLFFAVFKGGKDIANDWNHLSSSGSYIWILYIPMMTVSGSIILIAFNENFLASWIYHSMPIYKPGELITGAVKSLFIKFFFPVFLLLTGFCIYVWGLSVLDDICFALINNLMCFLIFANTSEHYLPFSRQPNTQQQSGKFLKVLLQMLVIAVTVGAHYLLVITKLSWLLLALVPLLCAAVWFLVKRLQNLRWNQVSI